ncbi:MAG: cytochrome c oxidase assembly protein [Hyphomonadaceae bacterium]|nr:cytochrome c oxidase assembly protein [Hyphomonadaceae bacterium]
MAMTAAVCVAVFVGMIGLAFAAPPLYRAFCRVTGYGGQTQVATAAPAQVSSRQVEVRFDANVAPGLPLAFEPVQRAETLHLGQSGLAFFRVRNLSSQPVTTVATFNVVPHKTGQYFQKLECFCFQDQTLAPGETREMPVVYFVDSALEADPNTEEVRSITLSYTFFRSVDDAADAAERAAANGS